MKREEAKKKRYIHWTPEGGFDLSFVVIPVGEYYPSDKKWEVRLDKESWFTCETQIQAEILSRLVRIERRMEKCQGRNP